jgi:serine/threonine-protein kinase ULK/ATG1
MKNLIRALLKRKPTERMSYDSFFSDQVIREEIPDMVDEDVPLRMQASEPEPPVEPPKRVSRMPVEVDRRASDSGYSRSPRDRTGMGSTPPSRPVSRPSSGHVAGTSPRTISTRRLSNVPIEPIEEHAPVRNQARPILTNAATAPGRPMSLPEQAVIGHRRRFSRDNQAPVPSGLKDQIERERVPQRTESGGMRDAAERAAQDAALDDGFVFVEKRRVEIDALADEIAASPQTRSDRLVSRESMKRRSTTQGLPTSTTGATGPSKAIQIQRNPSLTHQRTGSYERRRQYRPSLESATSALTKAMNMVNIRGLGLSPPVMKGVSPPQGYAAFPTYPTAQSSMLLVGDHGQNATKDESATIVKKIEDLAQLSYVIYGFAEVKYKQLVPVAPSDEGLGIGPGGVARKPSSDVIEDDEDDDLTPETVLIIAEEALVLYVKTLAMLNKAMDVAGTYWNKHRRGSLSPEAASRAATTAERLNRVVSWVRDRFNECCVKSEIIARKLKQAQLHLPADHPSHPQNLSAASGSATTVGSAENILLTTGVTAEKLMYERAIEMSRSAAVDELTGHNLPSCDINYSTAIAMLEAILEDEDESSSRKLDNEEINGLETEDRQMIQKRKSPTSHNNCRHITDKTTVLEQMRNRHKSLKKKLELQKAQKRNSITSAPAPYSSSRGSPSSQGTAR